MHWLDEQGRQDSVNSQAGLRTYLDEASKRKLDSSGQHFKDMGRRNILKNMIDISQSPNSSPKPARYLKGFNLKVSFLVFKTSLSCNCLSDNI